MKKNNNYYRIAFIAILLSLGSICSMLYGDIWPDEVNNYQITCDCYPNNFATTYSAVRFDTHVHEPGDRYLFEFEEMSGDLDFYQFAVYIDADYWNYGNGGYYPKDPINYAKFVKLYFLVLKDDVEPGASRNFRLKYKRKPSGETTWDDWEYSDEFTVSVSDINVSGPTGTLCSTSQTYSITPPTGYSASWSFSHSAFVSPSSGSGSSASMSGTCNNMGDGVLTFTMTKSSCPTFQSYRTITVNGPDPTDVELDVRYTNGTPVPKSGSVFQLCPYTHYHITLVNNTGCSTSNLSWTLPAGWTKNYQYSNMVSIYTNSSPGGQLIVKGQTCCSSCGSNMTLLTGYFGYYYSCGGYYMASPNPSSEYIDIDFAPEAVDLKEASLPQELDIRVYNKMGILIQSEVVRSLPYRINTNKLPVGNYVVHINNLKNKNVENSSDYESIQIVVEH